MVSSKIWNVINVSIALIIILLVLNLFGIGLPSLGQAIYALNEDEPLCIVSSSDSLYEWNDLDRCCLEAKRQVECLPTSQQLRFGETNWVCQSGSGSTSEILLNTKAYQYCRQQPVWQ